MKIKMSLKVKLLLMAILPVIFVAVFISFFAKHKITEGMRREVMIGLEGMVNSVEAAYGELEDGDYSVVDGELFKGDFNVSQNMHILDIMIEGTEYDLTLFYGKTRMATTLVSPDTGERMIGTDANDKVAKAVLEDGRIYEDDDTVINGKNYYVCYEPVHDSKGKIVGMVFAGIPSQNVDEYITSIVTSMLLSAAAIVVVVIIVCVIIVLTIENAIKNAENVIDELADGKLSVEMNPKYLNRDDEIGHMLKALNAYIAKMNEIIGGIHKSSEIMIESGKKLEEMTQVTSRTTEEINNAVGDISKGAVTQAEEIETATSHIFNIGEIIEKIVHSVAQLERTAASMKNAGDESAEIIMELSDSNDRTTEAIERIGKQVYATNESVQSIREAIAIIRSIAEETNLLSLNASIEAARAGEHGRGFAVVASEIQQLAEQSNDSSTRIEEIIDALLTESELTVQVMEEVKVIVEQQQRKLDDTKTKFEDVEAGISVCKEETEGIQGQTTLCDESRVKIVDIIQGLSAISEENAASTEETNASMEELHSIISIMAEAANELMVLSGRLDDDLKFFRY